MLLKNKTKNKIIVEKIESCRNIFKKAKGLMFSRKENKALIFIFSKEKIVPLHMLFVFYPIDIIFADKNKKVVEIKENFKPFSFYTPKNKTSYIIELPAGIIKKSKAEVGDSLSF